ncbi:MAG: hypothetical protein RR100_05015, partial [Comamonas sp.]
MQKNISSSRTTKVLQRTAIAAVVIAGSVLGLSSWAQKQAQVLESNAQAATNSVATTVAAKPSNLVPPHGQEGPQPI